MTPVLSLLVIVWVEVQIMQYDSVGSCQIDTKTPSSGGQDEDKYVRILVEVIYQELSLLDRCLTIQPQVPRGDTE